MFKFRVGIPQSPRRVSAKLRFSKVLAPRSSFRVYVCMCVCACVCVCASVCVYMCACVFVYDVDGYTSVCFF